MYVNLFFDFIISNSFSFGVLRAMYDPVTDMGEVLMYLAAILHHLYSFQLCARWETLLLEMIFKLRYIEKF